MCVHTTQALATRQDITQAAVLASLARAASCAPCTPPGRFLRCPCSLRFSLARAASCALSGRLLRWSCSPRFSISSISMVLVAMFLSPTSLSRSSCTHKRRTRWRREGNGGAWANTGGAGSVRAHLQGTDALLELRVVPPKIFCRDPGGGVLTGSARRGLHAIVQQRARRALLRQVLQRLVHEWTNLLLAHRLP